jgi:hypothetical protein
VREDECAKVVVEDEAVALCCSEFTEDVCDWLA